MIKSWPKISIVFPNHNGQDDCLVLIKSVKNIDYPQGKIELVLVDNASQNHSIQLIKKQYPLVKVIFLKKNIGPGAARNKGITQASGEYILSTDNDVLFTKSSLKPLVKILKSDSKIGAVGGKILDKKTGKLVSCGYSFNPWLAVENGQKNCQKEKECVWVAAAFMLFKKGLVKRVGFFDPNFFFYAEEADFCFRCLKKGFKILYTPKAIIYHGREKGQAPNFSPRQSYFDYYQGKFRLILKHLSEPQKISCLFFHLGPAILIRWLLKKEEHPLLKYKALRKVLKER